MRKATALLLVAVVGTLASAAAQTGSGAIARLEREFEDRFVFVTDGSGEFTVFQKLDPPLAPEGAIVCQMNDCLIAIAEVSAARLDSLGSDYGSLRAVITSLKVAADAQRAAQLAPAGERTEAMAVWAQARADARRCLYDSVCTAHGTLLQR